MTWQSGGGGGIPGVASDTLTPGGELVAGDIRLGDGPNVLIGGVGVIEVLSTVADQHVLGVSAAAGSTSGILAYFADSDGLDRLRIMVDGTATFANASGATQFQVDSDGVQVHGKLKSGASATHTLGAYSGKSVPIYDEAGTLLGYMPLYA